MRCLSLCGAFLLLCVSVSAAPLPPKPAAPGGRPAAAQPADQPAEKPAGSRKVVFVIDATGSMLNKMEEIHKQVYNALGNLKPADRFDMVVLEDAKARAFAAAPVPASDDNVAKAGDFLGKIHPRGTGDIDTAIAAALPLKPDSVWVATDGDMSDPKAVLAKIRKMNATHVPINTVTLFAAEGTDQAHFLWQLAHDSGGVCLDKDGKPVEEPGAPRAPAEPAAKPEARPEARPATKPARPSGPSIFKP